MNPEINNSHYGKRIRILKMGTLDPKPLQPGEEGTIVLVDDMLTIHVEWDSKRRLGLIPEMDEFELIE